MKKALDLLKKNMVFVLLIVLVIYFTLFARNFLSLKNITNLLRQTSVRGIMCVGFAIVMITGGLDLSVSSVISVVGCVTATWIVRSGIPPIIACIMGVLVAVLISGINAGLILSTGMPAMICTLAMQQVLQGYAYMLTQATPVYGLPENLKWLGQGYVGIIPIPVIIMVICFIIGAFLLKRTYIGRYFYAVGCNPEAARLSGVNVKKVQLISYLIDGLFVGIAGLVMMSRIFSGQPKAGVGYEMDVITACVVGGIAFTGGKGTISGLILGVLVMGAYSMAIMKRAIKGPWATMFPIRLPSSSPCRRSCRQRVPCGSIPESCTASSTFTARFQSAYTRPFYMAFPIRSAAGYAKTTQRPCGKGWPSYRPTAGTRCSIPSRPKKTSSFPRSGRSAVLGSSTNACGIIPSGAIFQSSPILPARTTPNWKNTSSWSIAGW